MLIIGSSIVMTVPGGPSLLGPPFFGLIGFPGVVFGGVWLLLSIWKSSRAGRIGNECMNDQPSRRPRIGLALGSGSAPRSANWCARTTMPKSSRRCGMCDMTGPLPSIRLFRALASLLWFAALPAMAAPAWLIATPDETARAGATIVLDIVKPAAQADWPGSVRLKLRRDGTTLEVALAAVEPVSPEDTRRTYRGVLPAHLAGLIRVELAGVESNRLALLVGAPDAIERMRSMETGAMTPAPQPEGRNQLLFPANEPALSVNEPMYFVIGSHTTARFQLSFKYRLFDPDSLPVEWFPPLAGLHFGYTQTSLWDLGANSAPFHDTSYRPSLFWQGATAREGLMPDLVRGGYEHESNGKDGANSRSIDTLFAQPVWRTEFPDGRSLIFAPKVYAYLDKSDNPDIQRYRGYANWNFRYGREDGWVLAMQLRTGTSGRGSGQLDLSWPLRKPLFARTGGFLHFQLFKGYGESLLDYNLDRGTQARVGFSIVR